MLKNSKDEDGLNTIRIGTILAFSVIGKIINGINPKDFTTADWKDIADNVADYGIMMDGQRYTEFVFNLFAAYIDYSVGINKESVSERSAADIRGLASDIRSKTAQLEDGMITEPDYVDDCLWISFEAMIKLLAAYKTKGLCKEYSDFVQAVANISVQYGRYKLYRYELALLNEYHEKQSKLDDELTAKYDRYLEDLRKESDEFNMLIDNAFSDDFDEMLRSSVTLARKAGVDEDEILDSAKKIDSYFLD